MPRNIRDHAYTVQLADQALGFIKSYELPGDPPSFEIWYNYTNRSIPALNDAINAILKRGGTITADEVDRLFDLHLGALNLRERVGKIGEDVGGEINRVVGMIDWAINSARRYESTLSQADHDLAVPNHAAALRAIVSTLIQATKSAAEESENYRTNLEVARLEVQQLNQTLEAIRLESRTDALTGLVNRKQFDVSLDEAIQAAAKTSAPLSLLMADVDHFKIFNDTWGHPLGDDVLRLVARIMKDNVRHADIAARYGGEEFALILPNADAHRAVGVAHKIRELVMAKEIIQRSSQRPLGWVSISIGVAQWQLSELPRRLVERADECLYAAKAQGRNRVVVWPPT